MKKDYVIVDAVNYAEAQFVTNAKFEHVPTDTGTYYAPTFSPIFTKAKKMTKPQASKLLKEMKQEVLKAFKEKNTSYKLLKIIG
jgi:hypothetical protein